MRGFMKALIVALGVYVAHC